MNANMNKILGTMFKQIDSVVWDLMNNRSGIRTPDGIYTLSDEGYVDLNPFDSFAVELPAFSQTVPLAEAKKGDVLVNNGKATGWVLRGTKEALKDGEDERSTIKALSLSGAEANFRPKNITALGIRNGVTIVRSPFNFGGEDKGGNAMQAMLPLLMMQGAGGKGGLDAKTLMMMSMMGGAGNSGMNPMMLMALMGGEEGVQSPFTRK